MNESSSQFSVNAFAAARHGRVAMAAFVGYCVQSNFVWPWAMTKAGDSFPSTDLSPEAQWDAMPANAKWQIFTVIAALEVWDECGGGEDSHYMRGRTAGKYPSFKKVYCICSFIFAQSSIVIIPFNTSCVLSTSLKT